MRWVRPMDWERTKRKPLISRWADQGRWLSIGCAREDYFVIDGADLHGSAFGARGVAPDRLLLIVFARAPFNGAGRFRGVGSFLPSFSFIGPPLFIGDHVLFPFHGYGSMRRWFLLLVRCVGEHERRENRE